MRRRNGGGAWWFGVLLAVAVNLGMVVVLARLGGLHQTPPPAPGLVRRIIQQEPPEPPAAESEPPPEPQDPVSDPPLAVTLPALDLPSIAGDTALQLPILPVSDTPWTLPEHIPAFTAVAVQSAPPVAVAANTDPGLPSFDEAPTLVGALDLKRFYPRQAILRQVEGETVIRLALAADGTVTASAIVSSTPPGVFDGAAERVVRTLRFHPAKRGGHAVPAVFTQRIVWKVDR